MGTATDRGRRKKKLTDSQKEREEKTRELLEKKIEERKNARKN